MSDRPTVVDLPKEKNEAAAAGDAIRRNMPALIENAKTFAQLRRAHYLAYLEVGFNEQQALELCKS